MSRKLKYGILFAIIGIVIIAFLFACLRYRANVNLGEELRKEVDAWLASLPVIPDEENGALLILEGLRLLGDLPESLREEDVCIDDQSRAKLIRDYLAGNEKALQLVNEGLSFEKWAYTTDYEKGAGSTWMNQVIFRTGGEVFAFKGDIDRLEGDNRSALAEYLKCVRLACTLSNERILTSRMIDAGLCRRGLERLQELFSSSSLSEEDLSYILKELIELHGKQGNAAHAFDGDYFAFTIGMADYLTGKVKLTGSPGGLHEMYASSRFLYDFGVDVEIYRRWRKLYSEVDLALYYRLPAELKGGGSLSRKIGVPELGSWRGYYAQFGIPDLSGAVGALAEVETLFRGTFVLFAVRLYHARNGFLPPSLDKLGELVPKELLTDPFSGKSLAYRVEGDDFYLYSAGYNGVDDKCVHSEPVYKDGVEAYAVPDIVFHAPPSGK